MMTGIGSTLALATASAAALGLGNGVGRPIGGIVYDRAGQQRTLVLLPALALAVSLAMAFAYALRQPVLFAPLLLADGVVYGMYSAINTSYMRTTFGQRYLSMNTGLSAIVLAPFNLVFPFLAARAFEATGSYELFFAAVPLMAAASLACGVLCKPANGDLKRRWGGKES